MSSNTAQTPKKTSINDFFRNIVNNYIPLSDETYNYAIPIGGFSCSCISIGIFMTFIYNVKKETYVNYTMYSLGYLVLAAGCAVDLHFGLRNHDKRQFFFWTSFKVAEMVLVLISSIYNIFVTQDFGFLVIQIMLITIKIGMFIYIVKRATSKLNRNAVYQENYYDTPSSEREPVPGVTVY